MINGTKDRRSDPALTALRQNWPILLVVIAGITTWTETRSAVADLRIKMEQVQEQLSVKVVSDFRGWQVGIERDIQDLRRGCK